MVRALSTAPKRAYENFLFATIGEDAKGVPVTVLSVMARADLDPWSEATSLAFMPRGMAANRLTDIIRGLSDIPAEQTTPENAARLVALLPNAIQSDVIAQVMPEKNIRLLAWSFSLLIVVIASIIIQWFYANTIANHLADSKKVPHFISAPQHPVGDGR
jgi:hypothetical protein